MIDNLSILLSHVLIALSFWILFKRDDLDQEAPPAPDAEPLGFAQQVIRPIAGKKRPRDA
jgi:hypothetical protein